MSDMTPNLGLPFMMPNQAQKHVTHNEALQRLDGLVQLAIEETVSQPPATAEDGQCFAIGSQPSGVFEGRAGQLAFRQDGAWVFTLPRRGWRAIRLTDLTTIRHDGTQWVADAGSERAEKFGIATPADGVNRLAVASAASLFTHAGAGHQMKMNKKAATDTASLLFQTGWSGRAEMGTTGSDDFAVKTSADGADWKTALSINGAGVVQMPQRPLVRASMSPQTLTPTAGSSFGAQVLTLSQGGFALGASLAPGVGKGLRFPVSGLYQITINLFASSAAGYALAAQMSLSGVLLSMRAPAGNQSLSATVIAQVDRGNELSLTPYGVASFDCGPGKTEISAVML